MGNGLGRTVIAAAVAPGRDLDKDAARADAGRSLTVAALVVVVAALALLPALVATGIVGGAAPWVGAGLGGLVAVVGGVKSAAVAWALWSRLRATAEEGRAAASVV